MVDKRLLSGAFLSLLLSSTLLLTFCSTAPVHATASWNVQTVDVNGYGGNGYCPVILDSGGTPHIAYTDAYVYYNEDAVNDYLTGSVMHARWNSSLGGFSTQKIARPGVVTDIALDAQDNPQILYRIGFQEFFQWNTESLKYASWTGSNWDIQTVNKNYTVYASLALDSSGNPNAAYSDSKSVKYASRNGSI